MNEKEIVDVTTEVAKEIAKNVYNDAGKPVSKPTGELIGLVPRAIKAALSPLEKWILQREYNVAETKKLLEEKLQNTPPELIESPEPHIAVPAMQYISYCMDNEELREMYANLLANSMNKVVKNGVHPGFVEIIKQLSPDEAKILRYINSQKTIPTITLRYEDDNGSGINIIKNFSDIGEKSGCENPKHIAKYFDNLVRLGLIVSADGLSSLTDKKQYDPLKNHRWIKPHATQKEANSNGFKKYNFAESFVEITSYGTSFCSICLETQKVIMIKSQESGSYHDQL